MYLKQFKILLLAPLLMAFQCDEDIGFEDDALIGTDLLGRWEIADYPPVQGGKSFDMSNVVEEFIQKARQ